MMKRILSLILSIALVLTMVPAPAYASEAEEIEDIHEEIIQEEAAESICLSTDAADAVLETSEDLWVTEETLACSEPTEEVSAPTEDLDTADAAADETVEVVLDSAENTAAVTELYVSKLPDKTMYLMGESINLAGLELVVASEDGTERTVNSGIALVSGNTASAGLVTVTVGYSDLTAEFEICVHERGGEVLQPSSGYPQSPHNYSNSFNQTYTYTVSGAQYLKLTFSSSTQTESNCDYIYIYNGSGTQLGKYSGSNLANQTITVTGDTVKIKLTSDYSVTGYGFSFSSIYAGTLEDVVHVYDIAYMQPTCEEDGYGIYTCFCGESYVEPDPGTALGHSYEEGICVRCGVLSPALQVQTMPEKTMYLVEEAIDLTGLVLLMTDEEGNGTEVTLEDGITLISGSTESAGRVTVTVGYGDLTAEFEICVHGLSDGEILQPSSGYPQSPHNYSNNFNQTYTYTVSGAQYLKLTFSSSTQTESNCDYIYIYNGSGTQLGKYSGRNLANQTITVTGDTVKIKLTSDSSQTYYGFSFSSIYAGFAAEVVHDYTESYTAPTCLEDGYTVYTCFCGESYRRTGAAAVGHVYENGICTGCGKAQPAAVAVHTLPNKTSYFVGETISLTGLKLELTDNKDNTTIVAVADGITLSSGSTASAGAKTVRVSYNGLTAEFEIFVHERAGYGEVLQPSSGYPQSPHNYSINFNQTYTYTVSGAQYLKLTFSSSTKTESNYDYIYIYNGSGTQLGKYSGSSLANQTITVTGNTVKIKLTSDSSQNYYGFSFSSIYASVPGAGTEMAHNYTSEYTAPTCVENGYTTYTCFCGDSYVVAGESATGVHSYGEGVYTDPTCVADGYTTATCQTCGHQTVTADTGTATGVHAYQNSVCTLCRKVEGALRSGNLSETAQWALFEDGTLRILGTGSMAYSGWYAPWGPYSSQIKTVEITDGITSITGQAFLNCTNLTRISIPDSVTYIGYHAFCDCRSLQVVYIPSSVATISGNPFNDCSSSLRIYCEADSQPSGWESGWNRYSNGQGDYQITPSWSISREENAFWASDAANSANVVIPDYITTIPDRAFYNRTDLKSVYIPSSVTTICASASNYSPFYGCSSSLQIYCEADSRPSGWGSLWNYYASGFTLTPSWNATRWDADFWSSTDVQGTDVVIPDYVTMIPRRAFYNRTDLKSITIPASVTSIGYEAFCGCIGLTSVTLGEGLTSIGDYAFSGCAGLTSVTLGENLTSIGSSAFSGCTGLTSITIPDSVTSIGSYAFSGCTGLTSVTLGENLTSIGNCAFKGCTRLASVTFGEALTSIGSNAFYNCDGLQSIYLPEGLISIGSNAFYDCDGLQAVYIPDSVTTISASSYSDSPFYGCSSSLKIYCGASSKPSGWGSYWNYYSSSYSLTTIWDVSWEEGAFWGSDAVSGSYVVIPEYITSIPSSAFYNRTDLKAVYIPASVTTISAYSENFSPFYGCSSSLKIYCGASSKPSGWGSFWNNYNYSYKANTIWGISQEYGAFYASADFWGTDVVIPDTVTEIPSNAFYNRTDLTSVTIPDSVTSIGYNAFSGCTGLTDVTIGNGVTGIGNYAFYNCDALTSVAIPDSVTEIGNSAFYDCTGLTDVTIGSGVTSIGSYAFKNCTALTSVAIPDSVTEIGDSAFYGCTGLTDVTIGSGVTSIGSNMFQNCTALTSVAIPDSVTEIGDSAFYGCTGLMDVTIGSGVTSIGRYAFQNCTALSVLTITDLAAWCGIDFYGSYSNPMYYTGSAYMNGRQLTSLTIPNGVTKIEDYAFYNCDSLTSVTIPGSVTEIGDYAFYDCGGLTSVTIPASITWVGNSGFSGCPENLIIRYGGTKAQWAQACCSDLQAICSDGTSESIISYGDCGDVRWVLTAKNVLYICGEGVMSGVPWSDYRDYIGKVIIGEGVTYISGSAFYGCINLSEITIPSTVSTVGYSAFGSCSSLKKVHISDLASWCNIDMREYDWPEGPLNSGADLYLNGSKVTNLVIPSEVTRISRIFAGCDSLASVVIPEGVTRIESRAFYDCDNLKSVTLPSTLTEIGDYAFYHCDLTGITLPESLVTIGEGAFDWNENLTEITFPRSVEIISAEAFAYCNKLKTITFRNGPDDILLIGNNAFFTWNKIDTTVKVPDKSDIHEHISSYDWSGSYRTVTYSSHNCKDGHYEAIETLTAPTCTRTGTGRVYCPACGKTITQSKTLPALGHIEVTDAAVEATCTTDGRTEGKHCERCSAVLTAQQTVSALGHSIEILPAVEAKCTSNGLTEGSRCTRCNTTLTAQTTITALGHDLAVIPAVEATCTATGMTEGKQCQRCGFISVRQQTVAKKSHTSAYVEAVAPTCTQSGYTAGYVCSVCDTVISQRMEIPALGHTEIPAADHILPTCTSTGMTTGKKCAVCEQVLEQPAVIAKLPHSYDSDAKCTVCGVIGMLGYGSCGSNVRWQLRNNGLLVISGTGAMANYSSDSPAPWYSKREQITSVTIESGVTGIGNYAFYNCDALANVVIADTVTSIGNYAFYDCDSIGTIAPAVETYSLRTATADIVLPNGITSIGSYAFTDCDSLVSVILPDSVTSIGSYAFRNCDSLVSVILPENITSISEGLFYDCDAITGITLPENLRSVSQELFYDCDGLQTITIPAGVTSIGAHAFYGCGALTRITIPESVTSIDKYAFANCDVLTGITLPANLRSISEGLFEDSDALRTVTIPDGVTTIGKYAFRNCDNLTEVTIPGSVTTIAEQAFYNCDKLTAVTVPEGVTTLGSYAFADCDGITNVTLPQTLRSIPEGLFEDSDALRTVTIPSGVTTIGKYAFRNCDNLTEVTIPGSVTTIDEQAFYNCDKLTAVTVPEGVTTIDRYAFADCDGLTDVTLPETLQSIPEGLFEDSDALRTVTIPSGVKTIGKYAFRNCDNLTTVTVQEGVTTVADSAFAGCNTLTEIVLPATVTSIGSNVFGGNADVKIRFEGTMDQWNQLTGGQYKAECSDGNLLASGSCGTNVQWFLTEGGVLTITGTGAMTNYSYNSHAPWYDYRELITAVNLRGINYIGSYAFYDCTSLTTVSIPDSVTGIGSYVFYNCDALTSAIWPENITSIPEGMFSNCGGLTEIVIPDGVTSIGSYAFEDCTSLASVQISSIAAWCAINFSNIYANPTYYAKGLILNGVPVTELVIPDSVTTIGYESFVNCTSLTEVTIPDSVTSIGEAVFYNCTGLTSVYIPASVTSIYAHNYSFSPFYGCSSSLRIYCEAASKPSGWSSDWNKYASGSTLAVIWDISAEEYLFWSSDAANAEVVVIPDSITKIPANVFCNRTDLKAVYIPASVTTIPGSKEEESPFYGCASDLRIYCEADSKPGTWGSYWNYYGNNSSLVAVWGVNPEEKDFWISDAVRQADVVIPDTVTEIPKYAFYNRTDLVSIRIPDSVTSIGDSAFSGCSSLTSVTIPDSVTSIGWFAFNGCSSLTSVTIPDSVTTISMSAFYGCSSLTSVTIPDSVTTIGYESFMRCTSLTEVTIPDSVTSIGWSAFEDCTSLTSVTIPDSVTTIDSSAFRSCTSLAEVTIPDSVTSIGSYAFSDCSSLTNVTIPDSVTSIGGSAFYGCSSLTSVTIPDSVASIGDSAFSGCGRLNWVSFRGSAPAIGGSAFSRTNIVAYYPAHEGSWTADKLQNYGGTIQWQALKTEVQILSDEKAVTNGTVWIDLNSVEQSVTLTGCGTTDKNCISVNWSWDDGPASVTDQGNGTVTVTSTGIPGQITLTATAADSSGTKAAVTVKFVSLTAGKEEIPGEDPADVNLLSGKSKQLSILNADTGKPLTAKEVTWSMDEIFAPYAKIDAKGKITAKKVVEKIRVEVVASIIGSEGTTVTMTVDIFPAVSYVEILEESVVDGKTVSTILNNKTVNIDANAEPIELKACVYPTDAMGDVTWTVSDKKGAYVTYVEAGNTLTLTPVGNTKPGSVTIKATSDDGSKKTATFKIQFGVYAQCVELSEENVSILTVGDKAVQLTAAVKPEGVSKSGVVWSLKDANDKNYVNLSASGKIQAKTTVLEPMVVTVVATSKDGMAFAEHTIRIEPNGAGHLVIKSGNTYVTKTTQILDVNTQQSIRLAAYTYGTSEMPKVTWSPLQNKAAEITEHEDGTLTVKMTGEGSITVTAKTEDKRSAMVTIKGVNRAKTLEISQKKTMTTSGLEIASGKALDLQAVLDGVVDKKAVWSIVEGAQFATVTTSGKVTANKDLSSGGLVKVSATASDGSGATDTMDIMVRPIAQGVQIYSEAGGKMLFSFRSQNWWVRSNTTLNWDLSTQNAEIAINAHVFPFYDGNDAMNAIQDVDWKSSSSKVADFKKDENGQYVLDKDGNMILIISNTGSTTITATAADGSKQKVSFKLNVIKTVKSLTIGNQTVLSGKSINLNKLVTINPGDATNKKLNWTITRGEEYATISNGTFKAKKLTAAKTVEVTVSSQDGGACKPVKFTVTITP